MTMMATDIASSAIVHPEAVLGPGASVDHFSQVGRIDAGERTRIGSYAIIEDGVQLGEGTAVWHYSHVRTGAKIGRNCVLGDGVFIDFEVEIGDNCKIQNQSLVYHGVTLKNGVFVGPAVRFTNDLNPRAINPDGTPKGAMDWELSPTIVHEGAAIGAGSMIRCGVTIGAWALIGLGSVVTKDVPEFGLVYGNPARLVGPVCPCGLRLRKYTWEDENIVYRCPKCKNQNYLKDLLPWADFRIKQAS